MLASGVVLVQAGAQGPVAQTTGPLADARRELAEKHFVQAKEMFEAYEKTHPGNIDARMGIADVDLALKRYETAETEYRQIVWEKPDQWLAHKNLVVIEAALGRWEEFDREREFLRGARARGAEGISARESDLIDIFDVVGKPGSPAQHWIVREYYEPAGRSLTRYNFERFSTDGRVEEYISLESEKAAQEAVAKGDVLQSEEAKAAEAITDFTLDWYTGAAHGVIKSYPSGEPSYEDVRKDVMRWVRAHPAGVTKR